MRAIEKNVDYEFHVKDLAQPEEVKNYIQETAAEIKAACGWGTDLHFNIEPEVKDKHLFSVAISVFGQGEPIIAKKEGKQVMATLRQVRKAILRQIHRLHERRHHHRKRVHFREKFA